MSPATGRWYPVTMISDVWWVPRSTMYAARDRARQPTLIHPRKRRPKTELRDDGLVVEIRNILKNSEFLGEGHRKVRARLPARGIRAGKTRVLRLMRENSLLAPVRRGKHARGDRSHSGRITTDRSNELAEAAAESPNGLARTQARDRLSTHVGSRARGKRLVSRPAGVFAYACWIGVAVACVQPMAPTLTSFEFASGGPYHPEGFGEWTVGVDRAGEIKVSHQVREAVREFESGHLGEEEIDSLWAHLERVRRDVTGTLPEAQVPDEVIYTLTFREADRTYTAAVARTQVNEHESLVQLVDRMRELIISNTGQTPILD